MATSITNSDATTDAPNHYNICDLSGFRALPGELIKTWDGLWVLPKYWEPKHPQLMVRSRPENQRGSIRPEGEDTFLAVNEVQAEDL